LPVNRKGFGGGVSAGSRGPFPVNARTFGSRSYKDDTMIYKPESEWIRHEALHEAIISLEVWNEVQAINRERTRLSADNAPPKPFLFTGKLICTDCKAPLQGNRETQRRKNGSVQKVRFLFLLPLYGLRLRRVFQAHHL